MNYIISLIIAGITCIYSSFEHPTIKAVKHAVEIPAPSNCQASPYPVTITQPDGSQLTIIGKGNLNNSWTETVDGFSIVRNQQGFYEYAQKVNGQLHASGVRVNNVNQRSAAETTFLSNVQPSLKPDASPLKSSILNQVRKNIQNKTYPTTGNIRVLALLIDYPDLANSYTKANFDSLLYANNYRNGDGSFKTFYETASNGQLTITVDVMGWFQASKDFIHYGRDSGYDKAADLVREAVDAAELAGVNFANYDNDSDGDVDGILAVHSGPGAESGSQTQFIWSHRWVLSGGNLGPVTYDGVNINDYMINPETRFGNSMVGIGVFCHEFGHNLGLPDLYDTDNSNGDSEGIGEWGLMGGGGWLGGEHRPCNFSAWSKEENGWVSPIPLTIGTSGSYTLDPSSTNINDIYRINTNQPNEYFLLENRQKIGLDIELDGEGLAIWHINTNKTNSFGNDVNADETLKGVDLEAADGNNDLDNETNRGDNGDLFPGSSNNTQFDDNSNPSAKNYLLGNTNLILRNINESGNQVSFDFGPASVATCNGNTILTNPSGSFDDGSGASNYDNGLNCSWLIQPSGANSITLTFNSFNVDNVIDRVAVYDGASFSAPLIGTYTGSSIPGAITSSGGSLYIEFTTNGNTTAAGWDVSYTSSSGATCSGTTTLTASNGTFSDGSGASNYSNGLNCSWLIQPPGAGSITFGLNSLATEINQDRIFIYDGTSNSDPLLGSYSGTNNLNTFTSTGGSMFVEFITNPSNTDAGWDAFYTSSSSGPSCNGASTLTTTTGSFSDGSGPNNYGNNQFCSWLIQPTTAVSSITLSFSSFATEVGDDRVRVFDGNGPTSPLLGIFSGSTLPPNLTSTGGVMYVEFLTGSLNTDQGWDATYTSTMPTATCSGQTTLTAPSGNFSDGSGPNNYSNGLNCAWLIQPTGSPVTIDFSLNSISCIFGDFIRVFDGVDNSGTLIGVYTGTNPGGQVTAFSGSMFVEFTTDPNNTAQGWDASYTSSSTFCQPQTTFTANSGNFSDGSPFSQNYLPNTDCSWLIQPSNPNLAVTLNLFNMNTELGNDIVTVYDGGSITDPIIGTYSGTVSPPSITSSGNAMLVTFKTNGTNNQRGWNANYTTQPIPFCGHQTTTLTAASGTFDDGSGLGVDYIQRSTCSWLIQPPGAFTVDASFNYFDTELNFDFVTVYNGINSSAPVLGTFSGTTLPPSLTASSGSMFVEFTSDDLVQAEGWEISYTSTNIAIVNAVQDTVYINAGAGSSASFNMTSNTNWTTSDNANWLIASPVNGSLSQNVNLIATQPNIGPPRSAMVFVDESAGSLKDTVVVIQRGSGDYMFANPDTVYFPFSASSKKFELIANVNWNVNIPSGPGTANPNSGNSNDSVEISLPANSSNTILTYLAVISGSSPNVSNDTVFLVQDTMPAHLNVSPTNLTLNQASGSNGNFVVNSNVVWQTSTPVGWLTINNPTNTSDTNTVQVVANSMNMSTADRSSFVAVQDVGGSLFDTVFVTQLGGNIFLSASPKNISLGQAASSSASSSVSSNISWVATSGDPSWLSVSPNSGTGNDNLNLTALTANSSTSTRSSFIALASTNGSLVDTIFVDQNGVPENLSVDPSSITLTQSSGSNSNFTINSNVSWQTMAGATWLSVINPTNTSDTNTAQVVANSANMGANSRNSYVSVMDVNGSLFDTVWVTQLGTNPMLEITQDTVYLAAGSGASNNIDVVSNLNWSTNAGSTWINANPTSGNGNDIVTLSALSSNVGSSQRISYLAINQQSGSLTDTVVVVQDTAISATGLTANPDTIRLSSASNSSETFTVTTNFNWSAFTNASWIDISPTSNTGSQTVTVTSNSANNSSSERVTFIAVIASTSSINEDTVYVIQEGVPANLSVNPASLNLNFSAGSNDLLNITSNLNWAVTNPVSWLSLSANSGSGDDVLTVTTNSDNLSGNNRSATLTFSASGVQDQTVSVTQIDGSTPSFNVSKDTVFVNNPQGSTGTFSVLANATNWSLSENTPWLLVNPASGSNTQTITVLAASRNVFGNPREASITITANGFPNKTVTVIQEEATPLFQVAPSMLIIGSDSADFMDFNISSNLTSWKINENTDWMKVNPDSGAFTQQIRVTAIKDNRTGSVRTGIITVDAPPLVPQTIMVTQDTLRTIGINENNLSIEFNLFPNPTGNQLNIEFNDQIDINEAHFSVYNNLGARVPLKPSQQSSQRVRYEMGHLPAGFYFLLIEYKGKRITKKISLIDN